MSWLPIFLIGLGVLLLFIELVLFPGFGAAGIPGIILIIVGIGIVWVTVDGETALIYAGITFTVTIPLAVLGLWLTPRTKFGKSFILNTDQNSDGFRASPQELTTLVGKSGQAITPLRPAGAVLIDSRRVDVVTRGEFIQTDTEVEVIFVEGNRVVVRSLS